MSLEFLSCLSSIGLCPCSATVHCTATNIALLQKRPSIIRFSTLFHIHPPLIDVAKKLGYALLSPCQFLLATAVKLYLSSTWYACSRNFGKLYMKIFITEQEKNEAMLLIITEFKSLRGTAHFLFRKAQCVSYYYEGIFEISQQYERFVSSRNCYFILCISILFRLKNSVSSIYLKIFLCIF